jgi:hypothetical protein
VSRLTSWLRPTTIAHADCDIPCGIYDPSEAVLAARTASRIVEIIGLIPEGSTAIADRNLPGRGHRRLGLGSCTSRTARTAGPGTGPIACRAAALRQPRARRPALSRQIREPQIREPLESGSSRA